MRSDPIAGQRSHLTPCKVKATVELGSTVKSKVTSPSTALFITASPAPHGELPEPLDIEIQHYDEELGVSRKAFMRASFFLT